MINTVATKLQTLLTSALTGITVTVAPPTLTTVSSKQLFISFAAHENEYLDVVRNKRVLTFEFTYVDPETTMTTWESNMNSCAWQIMETLEANPTLDNTVSWAGEINKGEVKLTLSDNQTFPCYQGKINCIVNQTVRN